MKRTVKLSSVLVLATMSVAVSGAQTGKAGRDSKSNVNETRVEEGIVKLVEAFRQQKGLPKLHRMHDSALHEDACNSAKQGQVTAFRMPDGTIEFGFKSVLGDVGNLSTFTYTTTNPNQLSPELQKWVSQAQHDWHPARFGVGVCLLSTSEHPEGTYWIDVGYYLSAIETFFAHLYWD